MWKLVAARRQAPAAAVASRIDWPPPHRRRDFFVSPHWTDDVITRSLTADTAYGEDRTTRDDAARGAPCARAVSRDVARGTSRTCGARVSSWTGRALASRATDSGLPAFVTAGTHRTRVSEMRDGAPRRRGASQVEAPTVAAATTSPAERSALGRRAVTRGRLQAHPRRSG